MSMESMSLNFALCRDFEFTPYWSLLRLSSWEKGATYITGGAGLRANFYFGPQKRWSLRARGEYSFGYGNMNWYGERIYKLFNKDEEGYVTKYEKPCTPFRGWTYGLSIGYRF